MEWLKRITQTLPDWRSLRFRLIGWYVLLLVLTLLLFSVYIFFQFRNIEQNQQDASLQAAASSVQNLIDFGPQGPGNNSSGLHFRNGGVTQGGVPADLNQKNIQVRLLGTDGDVAASLGTFVSEMPGSSDTAIVSGFTTMTNSASGQWRIYSQTLMLQGKIVGYLQVGQPLLLLDTGLGSLFTPIVLGTLIALLLAIMGGLFLANRALRPIDRVTRTAQAIGTHDLARRIDYHGPADEIGRLAGTLDQMLDRLEKGFEQERRFTSDASHELRTPLTALKGRIEVTLSRPRQEVEYRQTLHDLNQEVNRMVTLSSSLLYLARLDQAGSHWQAEELNLSDLLDSMVDSMQPIAVLKQIQLNATIRPDLYLQGNMDQLTRLFLNLIDNALKYTPDGGKVAVRVEKLEDDQKILVAVSDTGPGIAPEHLPHLFKRFYRAESDRASRSGGAGLGLAIANEIVHQHGGTMEVESLPGAGTTFKVLLPLTLWYKAERSYQFQTANQQGVH